MQQLLTSVPCSLIVAAVARGRRPSWRTDLLKYMGVVTCRLCWEAYAWDACRAVPDFGYFSGREQLHSGREHFHRRNSNMCLNHRLHHGVHLQRGL